VLQALVEDLAGRWSRDLVNGFPIDLDMTCDLQFLIRSITMDALPSRAPRARGYRAR
jgi:hypothetical protein